MVACNQPSSTALVSVILPAFNRLQFLRPAIDSILAQTFTDWELIIVDDGSEIETRQYLESFSRDPRVRLIWLQHSGKPAMVRNAGLQSAGGQFVAFMDS